MAGAVVLREHTANDILVDVDAEGVRDLLGDAQVSELGIAGLLRQHNDDGGAERAAVVSAV